MPLLCLLVKPILNSFSKNLFALKVCSRVCAKKLLPRLSSCVGGHNAIIKHVAMAPPDHLRAHRRGRLRAGAASARRSTAGTSMPSVKHRAFVRTPFEDCRNAVIIAVRSELGCVPLTCPTV